MNKKAWKLIGLLTEYNRTQYHYETHNAYVISGGYGNLSAEKTAYIPIKAMKKDLMDACDEAGIRYGTLLEIIPPPFDTNILQRQEILEDLIEYAEKKYG